MRQKEKSSEGVQIEEIFSGSSIEDERFLEFRVAGRIFKILYITIALLALVFAVRISYLWWYKDFYGGRAVANASLETVVPAERGIIFDRFQVPLAQNKPTFSAEQKPRNTSSFVI